MSWPTLNTTPHAVPRLRLRLDMNRMRRATLPGAVQIALLAALLCAAYLQASISEYVFGVTRTGRFGESNSARFVVELLVVVNFVWAACTERLRLAPGSIWFLAYMCWSLLSGLAAGSDPGEWMYAILFCRYTFYSFLVYTVAWNLRFSPSQVRALIRTVATLFILQIFATLYKVVVMADRTEWRVGTITMQGGILGTVFPLVALGASMGYYFHVRRSLWILLVGFSFGLVGFASGKRAIYFAMPVFFLLNALLFLALNRYRLTIPLRGRFFAHIGACALLTAPAALYGMRNSDLGRTRNASSSVSGFLLAAVDFARSYEMADGPRTGATGRTTASLRVLEWLMITSPREALLGRGPMSFFGSIYRPVRPGGFGELGIAYGIVGWSHTCISIGIPGVMFFGLAYGSVIRSLWRAAPMCRDSSYRAFVLFVGLSGCLTLLFEYFFYGSTMAGIGVISFLVLLAAGVSVSPRGDWPLESGTAVSYRSRRLAPVRKIDDANPRN